MENIFKPEPHSMKYMVLRVESESTAGNGEQYDRKTPAMSNDATAKTHKIHFEAFTKRKHTN